MQYSDLLEQFPEELRLPVHKLLERLREELLDSVKRSDFERLEAVVTELAEQVRSLAQAQARTEARLDRLTEKVEELAQAQARTEARLDRLTEKVEELAQAQARTEARLEELAQAQARTEARLDRLTEKVEELAQAQAKTEATVRELVRGQIRVEKEIASLSEGQKDIRRVLGGISHTLGFTLESQSYPRLAAALKKDFGVDIPRLYPRFLFYPDGRQDQINIYGEGTKGGKPVYALGEAKAQLGKRDIDSFLQLVRRATKALPAPVISFMVTYLVEPSVEEYAQQKGLKVYWFHTLPEPGASKSVRSRSRSRKVR